MSRMFSVFEKHQLVEVLSQYLTSHKVDVVSILRIVEIQKDVQLINEKLEFI